MTTGFSPKPAFAVFRALAHGQAVRSSLDAPVATPTAPVTTPPAAGTPAPVKPGKPAKPAKAKAAGARHARLTLRTKRHGTRIAVAGRVRGTSRRARVAIELRRSGHRAAHRVVTARRGSFRVALRPRRQGRYRAVARLVRRPHVHTSRFFRV
jgi:hypothetical protein